MPYIEQLESKLGHQRTQLLSVEQGVEVCKVAMEIKRTQLGN